MKETLPLAESPSTYARALVEWGRSNKFAPSALPNETSQAEVDTLQRELIRQNEGATPEDRNHMTIAYCPPQYLLHSLYELRGVSPQDIPLHEEQLFYMDVSSALSTHTLFTPRIDALAVESLEILDTERGTAALKLAHSALSMHWRDHVRLLLQRNLRVFHGVTKSEESALSEKPKLAWLFNDSVPHITLAHGVSNTDVDPSFIPKSIQFDALTLGNIPEGPHSINVFKAIADE